MILQDFIDITNAEVNGELLCSDLIPTDSAQTCSADSLLFIYRRLSGEYTTDPATVPRCVRAIVCDSDYAAPDAVIPIRVSDVRSAYAYAHYLDNRLQSSKMRLIAVTGTNGKTTTATLIYEILTRSGVKCGFIGTGRILIGERNACEKDYSMTTPDPALLYRVLSEMEQAGCAAVVMEASSHSISLGKIAPLKFEYGIFTNLSHEHMDFHKNTEDYYSAKLSLFKKCKKGIFNIDDEYAENAAESRLTSPIRAGIISRGDVYATDIRFTGAEGCEFLYHGKNFITRITANLPGAFNVYNIMLAICCTTDFGITPKAAKDAIASIPGIDGRMEVIRRNPTVIIDYAHTPYALECVMKTLSSHKGSGRLIVVFGCGGNRDKEKRPFTGMTVDKYADIGIITEDNSRNEDPQTIFADILKGICDARKMHVIPIRSDAIRYALSIADTRDIVAIIGKGHERYIIGSDGYRSFDERKIVSEHFARREEVTSENKA